MGINTCAERLLRQTDIAEWVELVDGYIMRAESNPKRRRSRSGKLSRAESNELLLAFWAEIDERIETEVPPSWDE